MLVYKFCPPFPDSDGIQCVFLRFIAVPDGLGNGFKTKLFDQVSSQLPTQILSLSYNRHPFQLLQLLQTYLINVHHFTSLPAAVSSSTISVASAACGSSPI